MKPLLRWAGSKRQLIPELLRAAPARFERYYEPFAGSACLFFQLQPRRAVLGDFNTELIDTYELVRTVPAAIAKKLGTMSASREFYYDLRSTAPEALLPAERAARFIYLNRFCFNGVFRTNRSGQFNVPRGVKTGALPSATDILRYAAILKDADLRAGDFAATISDIDENDFAYLDPPYSHSARKGYGEYGYGAFAESDVPRLIHAVQMAAAKGATVLVSYSDETYLRDHLSGWYFKTVEVRRHVSGFAEHRGLAREVLASNQSFIEAA